VTTTMTAPLLSWLDRRDRSANEPRDVTQAVSA
jgi:hypothetical protein